MPHVVVVGAGVFGVWTAHFLRASGIDVTIIDAYGPGNSRSSSGDESRILRCGYGPDALYTRFARRSRELWYELQTRNARQELPIWWPCGVLWLPRGPDPYVDATRDTLRAEGCPVEVLDTAALTARYPHLDASATSSALLEPDSGVLMARRAVQLVCAELIADGVEYVRSHVSAPDFSARRPIVRLANDRAIEEKVAGVGVLVRADAGFDHRRVGHCRKSRSQPCLCSRDAVAIGHAVVGIGIDWRTVRVDPDLHPTTIDIGNAVDPRSEINPRRRSRCSKAIVSSGRAEIDDGLARWTDHAT